MTAMVFWPRSHSNALVAVAAMLCFTAGAQAPAVTALNPSATAKDRLSEPWWAARHKKPELTAEALRAIDKTCDYLSDRTRTRLMHYSEALREGLPIATGVIEGACRYLVKDRMDRTGARWSLTGAEAVLRLRALRASGDFDAYWPFHLEQD